MKKQWFISNIFRAARAHLLRISEENNGSVNGGRCWWRWLFYLSKTRCALTVFAMVQFRAAAIRFYLHKEFHAAKIRFSLHKECRAAEIRFYLHKDFQRKLMKKQWFISKIFRAARAHLLRISEENNGSVDGGWCGWKWLLYKGKMRFALTILVKNLVDISKISALRAPIC